MIRPANAAAAAASSALAGGEDHTTDFTADTSASFWRPILDDLSAASLCKQAHFYDLNERAQDRQAVGDLHLASAAEVGFSVAR